MYERCTNVKKIRIAVWDLDIAYAKAMVDFISLNYNYKFYINYFTEYSYLISFIEQGNCIDILLTNEDNSYLDSISKHIESIFFLTENTNICDRKNYIYKYQLADKLVSDLLLKYAEANPNTLSIGISDKSTKIVCVFSPIGGTGKSTISLGLGLKSQYKNLKPFYLSLDDFSISSLYLNSSTTQGLSEILYYSKEKHKQLISKIEGIRNVCEATNIHFFNSPSSLLDIEETDSHDIIYLLNQLRAMSVYDIVIIDLSSAINKKNMDIMQCCDNVILLTSSDITSQFKSDKFLSSLEMYDKELYDSLMSKSIHIYNKSNKIPKSKLFKSQYVIDLEQELVRKKSDKYELNLNNGFGNVLDKVIDEIF